MAAPARRGVTQVKHKLSGVRQEFPIALWAHCPGRVLVGRWDAPPNNPYGAEEGAFSWGVWPLHEGACWGAYRMHAADGRLLAYRFDALERPRFESNSRLHFDDLLLDAVVRRDGNAALVRWEDEDELARASAAGRLTADQQATVRRFRLALSRPTELLATVDAWVQEATAAPAP